MPDELIFLDTEATGNELGKDRLCQVCYKTGGKVRVEYFKPPLPISVKAMSITHITNAQVADKPSFVDSEMKKELQELLKEKVLVAHNATFDIAMLRAEGVEVPRFICTLRLARFLDQDCKIPEYNLQYLRYFLELEVTGFAHDAEGDVLVLEKLFERLWIKVRESETTNESALEKMIEISSRPTLFKNFLFGKYKGQEIAEVLKIDRGYLEWLLNQKLTNGGEEAEEDWIYTLRHYLGFGKENLV
jgi:exodeoxyribonuclease X